MCVLKLMLLLLLLLRLLLMLMFLLSDTTSFSLKANGWVNHNPLPLLRQTTGSTTAPCRHFAGPAAATHEHLNGERGHTPQAFRGGSCTCSRMGYNNTCP